MTDDQKVIYLSPPVAEPASKKDETGDANSVGIQILEKALQSAKDGEIIAVAVCAVRSDNTTCGMYERSGDHANLLLSAIDLLHTRYKQDAFEVGVKIHRGD